MVKAAIIQSSYIPWKGYFDIISQCNKFVFLDDTQFTRRDWRTRNKIKFSNGISNWLTIPVGKPPRDILINQVEFPDQNWKKDHLQKIFYSYKKAPHFNDLKEICSLIYKNDITKLSDFNQNAIKLISDKIGIRDVEYFDSTDLNTEGYKSEKLINTLKKIGADYYISGPSAKNYMDIELFDENNIKVEFKKYGPYKKYDPLYGIFEDNISIIDLIAYVGFKESITYIKSIA